MSMTVEDIKNAITQLPQNQLRQFRGWYEKFDRDSWDEQIEKDAAAGKLDALAYFVTTQWALMNRDIWVGRSAEHDLANGKLKGEFT